jgi:hypothetical protein
MILQQLGIGNLPEQAAIRENMTAALYQFF